MHTARDWVPTNDHSQGHAWLFIEFSCASSTAMVCPLRLIGRSVWGEDGAILITVCNLWLGLSSWSLSSRLAIHPCMLCRSLRLWWGCGWPAPRDLHTLKHLTELPDAAVLYTQPVKHGPCSRVWLMRPLLQMRCAQQATQWLPHVVQGMHRRVRGQPTWPGACLCAAQPHAWPEAHRPQSCPAAWPA